MSDPQLTLLYGYCECGCGEKTQLVQVTDSRRGIVRGQPRRFIQGHSSRLRGTRIPTGTVFGRWTVLAYVGPDPVCVNTSPRYLCKCSCGATRAVFVQSLRGGRSTSCGCANAEIITKHGHSRNHESQTPTYRTWTSMKRRCLNTASHSWPSYGGRGITVCDRWRDSFADFLADMGERPDGTSIDRVDNDGNYEPTNCRWATPKEQAANRRPPPKRKPR